MVTVCTNETEKGEEGASRFLGQHSEELLPLLEWVQELRHYTGPLPSLRG